MPHYKKLFLVCLVKFRSLSRMSHQCSSNCLVADLWIHLVFLLLKKSLTCTASFLLSVVEDLIFDPTSVCSTLFMVAVVHNEVVNDGLDPITLIISGIVKQTGNVVVLLLREE